MALRTLVTINVVIFLAWVLLLGRLPVTRAFFLNHLALNPVLPGVLLEAWQLVTYNFLHLGDFLHLLFNMLWLWWIGQEYEDLHGPHHMLALYIIGGVGGGLLSVLGYAAMGGAATIYGASASVLALLAAVVTLYPQKRIRLFLFGSVRLLYLVVGYLALNVLFMSGSQVAVLAHLGGAGAGFLFIKAQQHGMDVTSWAKVFFSGQGRSSGGYAPGRTREASSSGGGSLFGGLFDSSSSSAGRSSAKRESLREERDRKRRRQSARRREVDRILDKISAEGYEALSDDEKRTLEEASRQ